MMLVEMFVKELVPKKRLIKKKMTKRMKNTIEKQEQNKKNKYKN